MLKNKELEFGPFRLDTARQLLFCGEKPIPLAPKAYDTLLYFLQNPQRLVTREELMKAVWPDSFVEDGNVSVNIFQLRKALGETDQGPPFIETVPRKGYRFTIPVKVVEIGPERGLDLAAQGASNELLSGRAPHAPPQSGVSVVAAERRVPAPEIIPFPEQLGPVPAHGASHGDSNALVRFPLRWIIAAAVIAVVVVAGAVLLRRQMGSHQLTERRLTSFAPEQAVTAAAISTGAKFIAYANPAGLFIQIIKTGETHELELPERGFEVSRISWFPDSASLLVSGSSPEGPSPSAWVVPVIGASPPVRLVGGAGGAVSPDGTQIAWVDRANPAPEVDLMSASGAGARTLVRGAAGETFGDVSWTHNGRRLLFVRYRWDPQFRHNQGSVVMYDIESGKSTTVVQSDDFGGAAVSLRDGRIVYTEELGANPSLHGYNLMAIKSNPRTGEPVGRPAVLTRWNATVTDLSTNASGTQLVLRDQVVQHDVYIADLAGNGTELGGIRRLTFGTGREDYPRAWAPDGSAVFFDTNRNGNWQIYRHGIVSGPSTPFVAGSNDQFAPRVSPDGKWLLYIERPRNWQESERARLMRVPISGGSSEMVLATPGFTDWRLRFDCPDAADLPCMLAQRQDGQIVFRPFDPASGFLASHSAISIRDPGNGFSWALAPDGQEIAWTQHEADRGNVHVIELRKGSEGLTMHGEREVTVRGWSGLYSINWAAGGGWFVVASTPAGWTLLRVSEQGEAIPIYRAASDWAPLVFPSPSGRRLAFSQQNVSSNVWVLQNF